MVNFDPIPSHPLSYPSESKHFQDSKKARLSYVVLLKSQTPILYNKIKRGVNSQLKYPNRRIEAASI